MLISLEVMAGNFYKNVSGNVLRFGERQTHFLRSDSSSGNGVAIRTHWNMDTAIVNEVISFVTSVTDLVEPSDVLGSKNNFTYIAKLMYRENGLVQGSKRWNDFRERAQSVDVWTTGLPTSIMDALERVLPLSSEISATTRAQHDFAEMMAQQQEGEYIAKLHSKVRGNANKILLWNATYYA